MDSVMDWLFAALTGLCTIIMGLIGMVWHRQNKDLEDLKVKMDGKANKDSTDKRFDDLVELLKAHSAIHTDLTKNISDIRSDVAYLRGREEQRSGTK